MFQLLSIQIPGTRLPRIVSLIFKHPWDSGKESPLVTSARLLRCIPGMAATKTRAPGIKTGLLVVYKRFPLRDARAQQRDNMKKGPTL